MNIVEFKQQLVLRPSEGDVAGIIIERHEPRFDKRERLELTLRRLGHMTNLNTNDLKDAWEVLEHLEAGNAIEMPSGTLYRQLNWENDQ